MIGGNGREFADCGHPWIETPAGEVIGSCEMVEALRQKGARRNGQRIQPREATHDAVKTKPSAKSVTRPPVLEMVPAGTSEGEP